jgi:hypothetical protein
MSMKAQPSAWRLPVIVISLAVGIPLIAIGLVVLLVLAIVSPRHFAVLHYGGAACAMSPDGRSAYVQLTLTERDDFPWLDTVQLDGANNASLVQSGWLSPPLGFATGETRPSPTQLSKAIEGSRHPGPLPSPRSNLVLKVAIDPARPASADAAELLIDNGEPAFLQTIPFHLHVANGRCIVDKG